MLTTVNFVFTIFGVMLVDKKGRKFLRLLGSAGIIISLVCAGLLFRHAEQSRADVKEVVQAMVSAEQKVSLPFDETTAVRRSNDPDPTPVQISRAGCLPPNEVAAFFQNPFADLDADQSAPLKIDNALISAVPSGRNGWLVALCTFSFMAFFALGPCVFVWLALSELIPTSIHSDGMSSALLVNQAVSTSIAATFLPTVGKHGYGTLFLMFAGCTVVYFIPAAFFLPETKGKTLEEIEEHFVGRSH